MADGHGTGTPTGSAEPSPKPTFLCRPYDVIKCDISRPDSNKIYTITISVWAEENAAPLHFSQPVGGGLPSPKPTFLCRPYDVIKCDISRPDSNKIYTITYRVTGEIKS
ncbi:hypothetical protein [Escherichia coli]|uniref:hypothetical protein n=1 Tax=Escherichia coli TaxID=562 RepID=UPI00254293FE|nr:hypothetical protein [Escherichia coli]